MPAPSSYPIPNLIQGVSQQAPMQRRDTQCESQFDCVNDVVNGATARPGADLIKFLTGEDLTGHFFYEINRGIEEHYLAAIGPDGIGGHDLRVWNLDDGTEAAVTFPQGKSYLTTVGLAKDAFEGATIEDVTFAANREVIPSMDATNVSPAAVNEAVIHFRAGDYLSTYQVSVIYNGNNYTFVYQTPDNSAAANRLFIGTNVLAATFYRAFTGTAAPVLTSGNAATGAGAFGAGAAHAGATTGVTAPITLNSLGFVIAINGNAVRIRRNDAAEFRVDVSDGTGNTHLKVAQGSVQAFSDLPEFGFDGFTVRVKGESRTDEDDYYVRFFAEDTKGFWREAVAPGIVAGLDPLTMPHQLTNDALNSFIFEPAPWGERVVGDEVSSPDPSFVGKPIQDIFHDRDRLAILTEASCVWSKTRNPFVYFVDTVQTRLATGVIDIQVAGYKRIALLRRAAQHNNGTFLWAQKAQFAVGPPTGESLKADTVEALPTSAYEFAEKAAFLPVGTSFYFATEPGGFATIRDLFIRQGQHVDTTDVTAHVSQYIPSGVRWLTASDTMNMMFVSTDVSPSQLFVYNWFIGENENVSTTVASARLQSAWNAWRLPAESTILWCGVFRAMLFLAVQRTDGVALLAVDLSRNRKDPGGDYLTRLDFRVTDVGLTRVYDPATDTTDITLPYVPEELDPASALPAYLVVVRTDGDPETGFPRGREFPITAVVGSTVTVAGDATGHDLYMGFRISAERTESEFWLRTDRGAIPVDRLQALSYRVIHSDSGFYKIRVEYRDGAAHEYLWEGRTFGDPSNVLNEVVITNGIMVAPISSENTFYKITLINDSFLPSHWQTAEVQYHASTRSRQVGLGNP